MALRRSPSKNGFALDSAFSSFCRLWMPSPLEGKSHKGSTPVCFYSLPHPQGLTLLGMQELVQICVVLLLLHTIINPLNNVFEIFTVIHKDNDQDKFIEKISVIGMLIISTWSKNSP